MSRTDKNNSLDISWILNVQWAEILRHFGVRYTKRSTGTLVALCYFHVEKTPSMHFWDKSGRFHCFGCAKEGNKLTYVGHVISRKRELLF